MAAVSRRRTTITYSNDVEGEQLINAGINSDSPAMVQVVSLVAGANTITVPTGGTTPTCCTIVKPGDNEVSITLKKVTGDTGIRLHNTDPDSISIDPSVVSFVLTIPSETVVDLRLFWS